MDDSAETTTSDSKSSEEHPLILRDYFSMLSAYKTKIDAHQAVAEQIARPEPKPVSVGTPIPPGTMEQEKSTTSKVFLPLVIAPIENSVPDIALEPDIWRSATKDWQTYELGNIADLGMATIRYPQDWNPSSLSSLGQGDDRLSIELSENIEVTIDDQRQAVSQNQVQSQPPSDILQYQESEEYSVEEATIKGLPSWKVEAISPKHHLCQKIVVSLPSARIHFQLQADPSGEMCSEQELFELIVASLQIRVNEGEGVGSTSVSEIAPLMSINWIDYNRQAAYNYQVNYALQRNNADGYYHIWSGYDSDGAHYLAHVMQAGGFPIHWNVGQNNSSYKVLNTAAQRNYVRGFSNVSSVSRGNLKTGDIIYINGGSSFCWGEAVYRMSGSTPYISTHSVETRNVRYDLYYCGSKYSHWYEYNHIDATADHPADPKLNSGLTLNPETGVIGENINASFNIHNYGGQSVNLKLRVATDAGAFSTRDCGNVSAGGNCYYNKSRSFGSSFTDHSVCAQMRVNGGSWQNIPSTSGGVTCRTLNIVEPADVRLSTEFSLTPNEFDHNGGTARAQFTVHNIGGASTTERFRASVLSGPDTSNFSTTGDKTLDPGTSYSYDKNKSFSQPGFYEVEAQHRVDGTWTPLIGNGSDFLRVLAPPPPKSKQDKGRPSDCAYSGEPVNTSNGNYFYDFTDLSDPAPGLPLAITRWYNALDADEIIGPFGHGTSWTYNMTVTLRSDKSALVRMPDGHLAHFVGEVNPDNTTDLDGLYTGQDRDTGSVLERTGDAAVLTTPDQTAYHFNADGRLTEVTHPTPATITVVYEDNQPIKLIHSAGITHTLTYIGSLITGISSSSGRTVTYTYTTSDDLSTVTRPDGSTYTYTYDADHRLTEARQPNGHAFVRNIYDDQGRVIHQYDQVGKESIFSYGTTIAKSRQFTDTLGNVITHTYDNDHRLIKEVNALGHTTIYTRDTAGNVIARQEKDDAVWRYAYDERGNMLSETNPLNNTWSYTYDAHNNRTSKTDPLGNTWEYEYDANDRLILTRDPLGHTHTYVYDDQGNLIWEQDENDAETWYEYNDWGLQTVITDALGNVTQMAYDDFGNQTVYTDANGNAAHFVYDDLSRLVRSIDPMGNIITFTYDAMGNLLTESDELGHLKHYTYDEYDRLIAETDFEGHTTRYAYDALGHRTVITDALGNTTVMTYNAAGQLVARQGKDGAVTHYAYDEMGRTISETDALGRTTEYAYDAAGRQTEVRRPCDACPSGLAISQVRYDAAGRVIEEIDPRGAKTQYAYDTLGRQAVITNSHDYTRTMSFDPAGRVIQETNEVGAVTLYEYDEIGQLITTTNALGYQTVNRYDAVGRQIWAMNERGYTTTYTYNANDQVVATTDALGNVTRNTYDAAGRLIATTDPLDRTTTYTYDANGNRLTETNPRGQTTTYIYDAVGRTIEVIEPASCCGGGSRRTAYDAAGRVISEANALGQTTIYTYNVVGRRIAERSPLGYTTVYTYNVADNRIARQDRTGAVWRYEYDASGNQIRQIDPVGNVRETEYDLLNRSVQEIDPLGATTERAYDPTGRIASRTDARGATTRYVYDALGRTVREITPLGYTRVYTYDAGGNRVAEQDPRGFVTTYVYDALDRQIAQIDPLGHTRYTLYDAAGQVKAEVDYNGNTTTYAYDATGNRIRVTDAVGNVTTTEYDAQNRPVAVTSPLGHTRYTAYNDVGQVVSETTPLGRTTVYTYNAEGRRVAQQDAQGNVWHTEFDAAGRPIREINPLGRVETTTYDALGRSIAHTDALSRTTRYNYDPAGRLLSVTAPDGTSQRYIYDSEGNILTERDGNGHITRYEYDLEGRMIRKTNPLGHSWHYRYDAAGHQIGVKTPSDQTIAQAYDALGRLIEKSYAAETFVAFGYDANGNRTVMTDTLGSTTYVYDAMNQLVESTDADGRTVHYTYDAAGQRTGLTYPDGSTAQYAYDADGSLASVTAPDGGVTIYVYDALDRQVQLNQANGVTVQRTYDEVGNVLSLTQKDASGVIFAQTSYTIDDVNRRVEEVEMLSQSTVTKTYTYDELDRLVSSVASDDTETHYAFDDAGNRTAMWGVRERNGITETYRVDYVYNAVNQLLSEVDSATGETTYAYDADGNRIMTSAVHRWADYEYDAEGHLVEAQIKHWEDGEWVIKDGVRDHYVYDGNGRRVRKNAVSVASGSVISRQEYRYDDTQIWDVLQTYTVAASTTEARYLYDQSLHKLAYWQGDESGYFQNDGLGSVLGATDSGGDAPADLMRYDDYGDFDGPESALPSEDAYTGYERDNYTGLYYARNRYYDAATGTFLSVDPYPADRQDVGDLHRYLYVQANPVNMTDPLGLFNSKTRTVENGDTLWNIAKAWGMTLNRLLLMNKKVGDSIYPGQKINLPSNRSAKSQISSSQNIARYRGVSATYCGEKPIDQKGNGYRPEIDKRYRELQHGVIRKLNEIEALEREKRIITRKYEERSCDDRVTVRWGGTCCVVWPDTPEYKRINSENSFVRWLSRRTVCKSLFATPCLGSVPGPPSLRQKCRMLRFFPNSCCTLSVRLRNTKIALASLKTDVNLLLTDLTNSPPVHKLRPYKNFSGSCVVYAKNRRPNLGSVSSAKDYINRAGTFRLSPWDLRRPLQLSRIRPGQALVWPSGLHKVFGTNNTHGHVAIVEKVYSDHVTISETNWRGNPSINKRNIGKRQLMFLYLVP
jgi:RHS repeat-associated protein